MGSKAMSRGQGGKKSNPGDSGEREAKTGCAGLEGQSLENKMLGETESTWFLPILRSCLRVRQRMNSHSGGVCTCCVSRSLQHVGGCVFTGRCLSSEGKSAL